MQINWDQTDREAVADSEGLILIRLYLDKKIDAILEDIFFQMIDNFW